MWCKAPGNSFNLTGLPSSADHRRGYERVAYVNNDHPVHFGDIFLVIIDINMARSLLFPSTEDTAILRHLPKKRPWTRNLWKLCTTGNSFSPPFRQIILQPSQKSEFIWNLTAKSKMAAKNRYDALMSVWNRQQLRHSLATRDLHHPRSTTHTGFRLHLIYNSHIYSIGTTMSTKTFWNLEAETSQVWNKAM